MLRALIAVSALVMLLVSPAQGQEVSLFDGETLANWIVEGGKAKARSGVIEMRRSSGWVRHRRVYSDFVLKTDVRLVGREAAVVVYLRSWTTFDSKDWSANAYGVTLSSRPEPGASNSDDGGWRRLEIECVGGSMVARLDGEVVHTTDSMKNPRGYIGFGVKSGTAELRNVSIETRPSKGDGSFADAVRPGPDIQMPQPIREVKPRYTAQAMRARIEGSVLLEVVVKADGTVGEVEVVRSLDSTYGLDDVAQFAASQWRFRPATRDGEPIALLVTIELTFSLGK